MTRISIHSKSKHGVYFIKCLINKKLYIGSGKNRNRLMNHFSKLRRNTHENKYLQRAFNLYGENKFRAGSLLYCAPKEMRKLEKKYILSLKTLCTENGFNMTSNTECAWLTYEQKEETKLKKQKINIDRCGAEFAIVNPNGDLIEIKGKIKFVKENNLGRKELQKLLKGEYSQIKGWRLPSSETIGVKFNPIEYAKKIKINKQKLRCKIYYFYDTEQCKNIEVTNLRDFCKENGLKRSSMLYLLKAKHNRYDKYCKPILTADGFELQPA